MHLLKNIFRTLFRALYYRLYGGKGKEILINNKTYTVSAHVARGIHATIDEIPLKLLLNLCKEADILFDIGANIGLISIILSKEMKSNSKIYSFEPAHNTFRYLKDTARVQKGNAAITPVNFAVSSEVGQLQFTDLERSTRNQITTGKQAGTISINATTVDSFCTKNNVVPQVIKVDIEGAEYWALLGMKQTLINNTCIVLVEIHKEYLESNGIASKMFKNFVDSINYKVFNTTGNEIDGNEIMNNPCVILAAQKPPASIFSI